MDTGSLRDDATPQQEPRLWPRGLPSVRWDVQRASDEHTQRSGPAPTGLVSCHADMRPLMTRFPPDRPHSPLFPLQPPKQGFGPGLGPQLPRSHRRLEVQRGAWGRSAPPHPSRWKAPSGPAGGSTESRGHQPGTNPAWKP